MNSKKIGLFLGPLLFILIRLFLNPDGLSDEANAVLASTLWIAVWWITEAIPIAVTSLLPIILFPLSGALPLAETSSSFGHRYVFLYMGGFILALAIEKWNLHKRIALNIIKLIGTDVKKIILGFMLATAFLSMWISNTATAVMMLPIGIAIIKQIKDLKSIPDQENLIFGKALMLSIAFSASVGGIATLIGTPPNLVFAGIIQELYGIEISFLKWIIFGLPISIILLTISWIYLTRVAFKFSHINFDVGMVEIKKQLTELGEIRYEEKIVLVVFVITGAAWISRTFFLNLFLPSLDDSMSIDSKESINFQDPFIGTWTIQGDRSSFSEIWFINSDGSFTLDDVITGNWSNKSSDFDLETQKYQLIISEYCQGDDCIENFSITFSSDFNNGSFIRTVNDSVDENIIMTRIIN